ncbi:MAG TPA: ABC transporter substrate-binding protein, partial [Peptostreptococcaceae bacterium]|nr:ABC transporter substrate-binding protein [Peptostreptococcaceae bacterium]
FDTVKIEFLSYDTETSKKSSEYIQSQLETNLPGIDVEIKQQPFKQKLDLEAKGQFNLSYAGWGADYPDPLTFLETFVTDAQYAAKVDYSNADFDKLIKEAKEAKSVEESWAKYAEAEKMFLDEGFLIPIYQRGDSVVQRDYVHDIVEHSYGADFSYKWAYLDGKKELNITDTSDIPSMDVSKSTDAVSFNVINNTMEGLTRTQKDGTIGAGMAEKWESSEDGKTWTFHIRDGAKWSNGDTVSAKDFEFSWKRTLDPATASEYAYVMYDIVGASDYNTGKTTDANGVGVKAIDDNTLQVTLNRPVNYFDKLMAFQVFYPQNEKVVKAQGDKYGTTLESVVYNGPFTLTTWKLEDSNTMTKNPNYWDASAVKLEKINTKIVKDVNAVVNLYESKEIDRINRLSAEHVDKYKDSKEFHTKGMASTYFLLVKNGEKK